jgi:lipid-A-disaccharide synthase
VRATRQPRTEFRLFLIAGEHSGDALGGKLMAVINRRHKGRVRYLGVGGEAMEREGLISQVPLSDIAVMGPLSILPRLPRIARRIFATVGAAIAAEPDAVVIIDSPEFTHPIAKRIRKRRPDLPIIDYVSPSVWAWRPGRARKMRRYVDHVLALLPFEPEAHRRLGGPPCTYVGHPLVERLDWLRGLDPEPLSARLGLSRDRPILVVLPGSRPSEVTRLIEPFGDALRLLFERGVKPEVIVPSVPSVRALIDAGRKTWPLRPHIVDGEEDKFRAFKLARAALAASGTVTLELAVAGTPMVVAYKVDALAARLRFLLKVPSIVLANLVLGRNVFPEFIQEACTGEALASALAPLIGDGAERATQLAGLAEISGRMATDGTAPSERAADVVLGYAAFGRSWDPEDDEALRDELRSPSQPPGFGNSRRTGPT